MAWTNLSFGVGSKLTATKMTQLQANFQAMASGDSGAPTGAVVAAGWVNFNGTGTVSIRDSFNVASITDGGVGIFTVNWSASMGTNNYAVVCSAGKSGVYGFSRTYPTFGTTTTGVTAHYQDGTTHDPDSFCVIAFKN